MKNYCVIKTTFSKKSEAKKIAKILLEKRLVACAQISTTISSYIWERKIAEEKEFELSLKTKSSFYKQIEKLILEHHSYQIAQIIALPISEVSKPYDNWMDSVLKNN